MTPWVFTIAILLALPAWGTETSMALSKSGNDSIGCTDVAIREQPILDLIFQGLQRMDARFDCLEAIMDRLEATMDRIEARFDRIEASTDRFEANMDRFERSMDRIESRIEGSLDRIEAVSNRSQSALDQIAVERETSRRRHLTFRLGHQRSFCKTKYSESDFDAHHHIPMLNLLQIDILFQCLEDSVAWSCASEVQIGKGVGKKAQVHVTCFITFCKVSHSSQDLSMPKKSIVLLQSINNRGLSLLGTNKPTLLATITTIAYCSGRPVEQRTMSLINKPIPPDSHTSPTTTSTQMDLPIEIWVRIFEHLPPEDSHYARPDLLTKYTSSLPSNGDTLSAAHTLQPFEKRCWSQTRRLYYAINRTSRAAALKLKLCLRVLQTCKEPVVPDDILWEWNTPQRDPSPVAAPRYVALRLFAEEEHHPGRINERQAAYQIASQGGIARQCLSLISARHVVLLPGSWGAPEQFAWTEEVKSQIVTFWRGDGIWTGKVEIMM